MNESGFVPLYSKLFNFYKEKIIKQEYMPGDRIDSINRIMGRHKVSRETAKLVLQMLSDDGFITKKAGKGSYVTFTRETLKIWGIVVPFYSTNIEDLIGCLNEEAREKNREIRFFLHYNEPEEEIRLVGTMIRNGYEAVIIVPNYDESLTAGFYRNLNHGNTTVILADNTMVGSFFNYVIQSYDLGAKRAFNYLIAKHGKNILFVKNEIWRGRNLVYELMERSLQLAIAELSPERKLLTISDLMEFNREFILINRIGGVLCSADTDSLRITGRLLKWGIKIPEEVSVVSYGNTELTRLANPTVTSVDCRYPEMAELVARLISEKRSSKETRQFIIQPNLIIRET